MQFNNMKITKDWWDAMRANDRIGIGEAETTVVIVKYKEPQDLLIKELIRAGNYQTPEGLIDMMVDNMYSDEPPNIKQYYKQYYRKWQKYNRK